MATPAEIAAASSCFRCISDFEAALLYLLATNAGIMDPATIAANSACYRCIPDFEAAVLYLLDNGGSGGGSGGDAGVGSVLLTTGDPEGVLTAPTAAAIAYDAATGATYEYTGVAGGNTGWVFKV